MPSTNLIFISAFACTSAFLFGYDLGLIGGALPLIQESLGTSDALDELIVGIAKLGAVLGAFVGAVLMKYGRKLAMIWDAAFFLVGPCVMTVYAHVSLLIIGRFLLGIGIGVSAVVVPAYLGEVSPAAYRGRVVGSYELMLCLGMLCSSLVDALVDSLGASWKWMVGLPLVPAVFMAAFVWKIPESPRWLVSEGRLDEALAVMHAIQTSADLPQGVDSSTATVEGELLDMWNSVQRELVASSSVEMTETGDAPREGSKDRQGDKVPLLPSRVGNSSIDDTLGGDEKILPYRKLTLFESVYMLSRGSERRAFWTVMTLAAFNQACASTAIINYAPTVFESQGVTTAKASLFGASTGLSKLLGVIISFFLVDRVGRRPLLIFGSVGSALGLLAVAVADAIANVTIMVLSMSLFIFFFSLSWAEIFWIILSEVFSMKSKASAIAMCTATLFLVGSVADMSFLTVRNVLGFSSFVLYSGISLLGGVFVHFFLPETRGKTLAEVQESFASL
jgi:MFS family permease